MARRLRPERRAEPMLFFRQLVWLDGRPLMETIELYRRTILSDGLFTFDDDGRPRFNFVLCGRAKKNWKTTDLILAALYRFLAWPSDKGNDCFILANDEGQAADDRVDGIATCERLARDAVRALRLVDGPSQTEASWIERLAEAAPK